MRFIRCCLHCRLDLGEESCCVFLISSAGLAMLAYSAHLLDLLCNIDQR